MRIFISAPYSAKTDEAVEANVSLAVDASIALLQKGHIPYCPHLSHYIHLRAKEQKIKFSHSQWVLQGLVWLGMCQAVIFLGDWKNSKGCQEEYLLACRNKMQIFYDLKEVT